MPVSQSICLVSLLFSKWKAAQSGWDQVIHSVSQGYLTSSALAECLEPLSCWMVKWWKTWAHIMLLFLWWILRGYSQAWLLKRKYLGPQRFSSHLQVLCSWNVPNCWFQKPHSPLHLHGCLIALHTDRWLHLSLNGNAHLSVNPDVHMNYLWKQHSCKKHLITKCSCTSEPFWALCVKRAISHSQLFL